MTTYREYLANRKHFAYKVFIVVAVLEVVTDVVLLVSAVRKWK